MSFLPPSTISLGGTWGTNGNFYSHTSNGSYDKIDSNGNIGANQSIKFTDNNGVLTLDVNPPTNGSATPNYFNNNLTSGTVTTGQLISLKKSDGTVKGTFTVPDFYTGSSGGGTSTEEVLVEDARMVFYESSIGWRFEQRGFAAGSYQLIGGTVNHSWTVSTGSNNLQYHISPIPAGGTYYLYSGTNVVATLSTVSASKKVFCNFW